MVVRSDGGRRGGIDDADGVCDVDAFAGCTIAVAVVDADADATGYC
jgi:hypothetical protein